MEGYSGQKLPQYKNKEMRYDNTYFYDFYKLCPQTRSSNFNAFIVWKHIKNMYLYIFGGFWTSQFLYLGYVITQCSFKPTKNAHFLKHNI